MATNPNTTIIGNKEYTLNIRLFNEMPVIDNNGKITDTVTENISLNKNALLSLVIDDNIFNPFSEAILILNSIEVFEKTSGSNFSFRGNGRDIVYIEFMQTIESDTNVEASEEIKQIFMLTHAFVVTECHDIQYNNSKAKRLKLVELPQYVLNERKCTFNTGNDSNSTDTNKDRSANTGDIIQSLLFECLNQDNNNNIDDLIDVTTFDKGKQKMFLSFSGDISYSDAINYIRKYHLCVDPYNDSGILSYGRHLKKFTFESMGDIFKEHVNPNKKHGIETLIFSETINQNTESKDIIKYPTYATIFRESLILKFNINNPSGNSSSDFLTNIANISVGKPVNTHIIDLKQGNIKSIIDKFTKLYIDPFKQMYGNVELEPNFDLNFSKLEEQSKVFQNKKNDEPRDVSAATINQTQLGALLFLQNTYNIMLEGVTSRQSGKFVDIVNNGTLDVGGSSRWDKYHIGRHFITSIKHVITQDRYINLIETIKPYRIKDTKNTSIISKILPK